MVTRVQPAAVPASQAPFSQVVLDDHYAFLAGLVAADFPAGVAVLGDVAAETRAVLDAIGSMLDEQGVSLDLGNLLVISAVFGFGGSLVSLAMSKWIAKRTMGAHVITEPSGQVEQFLIGIAAHTGPVPSGS